MRQVRCFRTENLKTNPSREAQSCAARTNFLQALYPVLFGVRPALDTDRQFKNLDPSISSALVWPAPLFSFRSRVWRVGHERTEFAWPRAIDASEFQRPQQVLGDGRRIQPNNSCTRCRHSLLERFQHTDRQHQGRLTDRLAAKHIGLAVGLGPQRYIEVRRDVAGGRDLVGT